MTKRQKTEAEKADELERLKNWVMKILPNDHDKVDTKASYDPTLNYSENQEILREHLKHLVQDLKSQVDIAKAQQERIDTEKINRSEAEVAEYNRKISFTEIKELDAYYAPIERGIKKMCQGFSNLLFIRGRGGIGKTHNIRKALIKNNANFIEIAGDVTEAYLYRLIYENNDKIIYLKETAKLLQLQGTINLLKSATETEDAKVLTKSNYSKEQDDLPDSFLCRAKFIFDYNNIYNDKVRQDFEALVTRGDYKELQFSDDDVKNILRLIAQEPWQKEVTEFIIGKFESNGLVKLNLRTQWKAFRTYEYALQNKPEWRSELEEELKNISRTRSMLYSLIGTKAIKTTDLKRMLLRQEIVNSVRTAERKVNDWMFMEELHRHSEGERDYYVAINPKE